MEYLENNTKEMAKIFAELIKEHPELEHLTIKYDLNTRKLILYLDTIRK